MSDLSYSDDLLNADKLLLHAAEVSDMEGVKNALCEGANINAQNNMGRTALHIAVSENNMKMAEILINAGADVNIEDRDKDTPLHYAARNQNVPMAIDCLLIQHGADINVKNIAGFTPRSLRKRISEGSCRYSKCEMFMLTDEQKLLYAPYDRLLYCIVEGDTAGLKRQLEKGININMKDCFDRTLLHHAAKKSNIEIVRMLIDAGADVNACTDKGKTPLHYIIDRDCIKRYEILPLLMNAGANINAQDKDGMSAILIASIIRDEEMIKELIRFGADVNVKEYIQGFSLLNLMAADENGDSVNIVQHLINAKADFLTRDNEGNTPLHCVQTPGIADLLIKAGAEVNAVNRFGCTSLHKAIYEHNTDIIKLLIKAGANVNAKDYEGVTPYLLAYKKDECEMLLAAGADKEEENRFVDRIIASRKPVNYRFCRYGDIDKERGACAIHLVKSVDNLKKLIAAGADINKEYIKHISRTKYSSLEWLTAVHVAVENDNAEALTLLIESGADLNIPYKTDTEDYRGGIEEDFKSEIPPLALALKNNSAKIVEMLIDAGADVNGVSKFGSGVKCIDGYDYTAIIEDAIEYADSDCLEMLIKAGVIRNDDVLEKATQVGNAEKVKLLVEAGANAKGTEWLYAEQLSDAVRNNNLAKVKEILAGGGNVNATDVYGNTALHNVSFNTMASIVEILINAGANINRKNPFGRTALHCAMWNETTAKILIENGANVNALDNEGKTPLHTVHDINVARVLLEHGANVNAKDNYGKTPLHYKRGDSFFDEDIALVKLLIEYGADVNTVDDNGRTPLHDVYDITVARSLTEHGANVNVKDNDGKTPLHVTEKLDIAELLIDNRANVNMKDNKERTPLHYTNRDINILKLLIKNGANINAQDNEGRTPLHLVQDRELRLFLIENGADVNIKDAYGKTVENCTAKAEACCQTALKNFVHNDDNIDDDNENIDIHYYDDYIDIPDDDDHMDIPF